MKKTYTGKIEFKADSDETGAVSAEFATLDVIDRDGDVTKPGAFKSGQETVIEGWNHNYSMLPVGKGTIREEGDKALFEGQFFLDTSGGLEHYKVVKNMGPLQEWSYTFDIEQRSLGQFDGQDVQFLEGLDVWGVAPVQRGAGIDTRTTRIKRGKDADPEEDGASDDAGQDEGQTEPPAGGDGEPSGIQPGVLLTEIEIDLIELEA